MVMDLVYIEITYLACTDRLTGWLMLNHLEPGHATISTLMSICQQCGGVLSTDYPRHISPIQWLGRALSENRKEDSEWKHRLPGFLGQWRLGHLAVPSFTANPLQATAWMGSGSTTPWGNPPQPQCKNRMITNIPTTFPRYKLIAF